MGFVKFSWIITLIATCLSAIGLFVSLLYAKGAPQEAAAGAIAAATAIIPYVFTRAIEGMRASSQPPFPVAENIKRAAEGYREPPIAGEIPQKRRPVRTEPIFRDDSPGPRLGKP